MTTANALLKTGDKERALKILDKCQESLPEDVWPLESIPLGFTTNDYMVINMIGCYFKAGEPEKAAELGRKLGNGLLESVRFYLDFYDYADQECETAIQFIYYLVDELEKGGDTEVSAMVKGNLLAMLKEASGNTEEIEEEQ